MSSGGLVLVGRFSGEEDLNPGPDTDTRIAAGVDEDAFVGAFDVDLRTVWIWTSGGPDAEGATAVTSDGEGRIYVAIWTGTSSTLLAFAEGGGVMWTRLFPGIVDAMAARPPHGLLLAGRFFGEGDFDPGLGEDIRTPAATPDTFVTRLTADGTY